MGTLVTPCAASAPPRFSVPASVQSTITIVHGVKYRFWMKTWAQRKDNGYTLKTAYIKQKNSRSLHSSGLTVSKFKKKKKKTAVFIRLLPRPD